LSSKSVPLLDHLPDDRMASNVVAITNEIQSGDANKPASSATSSPVTGTNGLTAQISRLSYDSQVDNDPWRSKIVLSFGQRACRIPSQTI
jgi:hypothetical protein